MPLPSRRCKPAQTSSLGPVTTSVSPSAHTKTKSCTSPVPENPTQNQTPKSTAKCSTLWTNSHTGAATYLGIPSSMSRSRAESPRQAELWVGSNIMSIGAPGITLITNLKVDQAVVVTTALRACESFGPFTADMQGSWTISMKSVSTGCWISNGGTNCRHRGPLPCQHAQCTHSPKEGISKVGVSHIMRMEDERIPKFLRYGALIEGRLQVGRSKLYFKHSLKTILKSLEV